MSDLSHMEQDMESMVGSVITFNGLPDYIARHVDDVVLNLEGHVGIVCNATIRYWDDGDPENGPHLAADAWFDVYVPALRTSVSSTPDDWHNAVQIDWIATA